MMTGLRRATANSRVHNGRKGKGKFDRRYPNHVDRLTESVIDELSFFAQCRILHCNHLDVLQGKMDAIVFLSLGLLSDKIMLIRIY
jgi:hypothetical protein